MFPVKSSGLSIFMKHYKQYLIQRIHWSIHVKYSYLNFSIYSKTHNKRWHPIYSMECKHGKPTCSVIVYFVWICMKQLLLDIKQTKINKHNMYVCFFQLGIEYPIHILFGFWFLSFKLLWWVFKRWNACLA